MQGNISMQPTPESVGSRIIQARFDSGVSREVLAAAAGVSLDTIKRYEAGKGPGPTFVGLCAIAEVTEKPVEWFMEITGNAA
jgi:transcriptional regulator with XRE-family HTH domain